MGKQSFFQRSWAGATILYLVVFCQAVPQIYHGRSQPHWKLHRNLDSNSHQDIFGMINASVPTARRDSPIGSFHVPKDSSWHPDCPMLDNTELKTENPFTIRCNIDFPDQNLLALARATFWDCVESCVQYNSLSFGDSARCQGVVFASERPANSNDCYLKSGVNGAISATTSLIGAVMHLSAAPAVVPRTPCPTHLPSSM